MEGNHESGDGRTGRALSHPAGSSLPGHALTLGYDEPLTCYFQNERKDANVHRPERDGCRTASR
jgi:hypothetical protein